MRRLTRPLFCVLAFVGVVGCGADQASSPPAPNERESSPLELTVGDACGDAYFWAVTDSGDVAVTVSMKARGRSLVEATALEFSVPSAAATVEVLEGENLARNFCTDMLDAASEPKVRQDAVAGQGTITLEPMPEGPDSLSCGSVSGELELTDLEADNGTTFASIRVTSDSIGCDSG